MKGSTNSDAVDADGEKTPDEQSDTSISNIGAREMPGCPGTQSAWSLMPTDIATDFERIGMEPYIDDHSSEVTTAQQEQGKERH